MNIIKKRMINIIYSKIKKKINKYKFNIMTTINHLIDLN